MPLPAWGKAAPKVWAVVSAYDAEPFPFPGRPRRWLLLSSLIWFMSCCGVRCDMSFAGVANALGLGHAAITRVIEPKRLWNYLREGVARSPRGRRGDGRGGRGLRPRGEASKKPSRARASRATPSVGLAPRGPGPKRRGQGPSRPKIKKREAAPSKGKLRRAKGPRGGERGGGGVHSVRYRGAKYIRRVPLDSERAAVHKDEEEGHRVARHPSNPSSIGVANTSIANTSGGPVPTTKKPWRPVRDSPTVGEDTSCCGATEPV